MEKAVKIKITAVLAVVMLIGLVLSACTSRPARTGGQMSMNSETKLAIGIMKLEGTEQAITVEEAKNLLPLWKAVKSLMTSTTASSAEVQALYDQIKETLTSDQARAIDQMDMGTANLRNIMQDLGISSGQGPGQNTGSEQGNGSSTQQERGNQGFGGGGFPGDGGPPGGFGGGGSFQGQRPTSVAGATNNGSRGGGVSSLILNAVIQFLEKRAGS